MILPDRGIYQEDTLPNLPVDVLDAAISSSQRQDDEALGRSIAEQAAPVRRALFGGALPELGSLLSGLNLGEPSAQPATGATVSPAEQSQTATVSPGWQLPGLDSLLSGLNPEPKPTAQPVAVPAASSAPAPASPPTVASGVPQAMPSGGSGAFASNDERLAYVADSARRAGHDPDVAQTVARSEGAGPLGTVGDNGTSFGALQAHVGGGQGDDFRAQTGLDPSDPKNERALIDWQLSQVSRTGWTPFHGAAAAGIGQWQGVGSTPASSASAPAARPTAPAPEPVVMPEQAGQQFQAGSYTPNQINAATAEGLDYETALAVCGPAAAIAFARKNGRNPTMQEAVGIAQQVGWTVGAGMAGPASEQQLLERMGVAARLQDGVPDWRKVAVDVQRGNPVIVSTPGHYFVAERYDPESGAFDFGESAAVLKASKGRRWFRPEELSSLGMGDPRASLFMDSPQSPSPSVVAGRSRPTAGSSSPAEPPPVPPAGGSAPQAAGSGDSLRSSLNEPGQGDTMQRQALKDQGLPEPMPGPQGPYDQSPLTLPGATLLPGPGAANTTPNAQDEISRRAEAQMYRQPLTPTMGPDTATGSEYDSRDADQGAHEWIPPTSEASSPVASVGTSTPLGSGAGAVTTTEDVPSPSTDPTRSASSQTWSPTDSQPTDPTLGPPLSEAGPEQPSPVSGLQAVYDEAGNFLHWIQGRVGQTLGAAPSVASRALERATGPLQAASTAAQESFADVPTQTMPAPARAVKIVSDTAQAYGDAAARRVAAELGVSDEELFSILGHPVSGQDIAGLAGGTLMDPTTYVGAGEADPLLAVGKGLAKDVIGPAARRIAGEGVEAARGLGTRVTEGLARNAENVAAADARMAAEGGTSTLGTLGAGPEPRRMYHGTAEAFPTPDPGKFDRNGLYGPGYYLTDNPEVASSYADMRSVLPGGITPKSQLRANRLGDEIAQAERELANPQLPSEDRAWFEANRNRARTELDRVTSQGPNVRAVDVPEGLNLLDASRSLTPDEIDRVRAVLPEQVDLNLFEATRRKYDDPNSVSAVRAGLNDVALGWHERDANVFLARAGFDGISYPGGQIMPIKDAVGNAVEHQAHVIFPESLTKIRNAFSGEVGGATLGQSPGIPGAGLGTRLAADVGSSLGSGTMGAAVGAGLPADTDEERRRNALIGAGVGMVAGPAASRLMRRGEGALATPGVSPGQGPRRFQNPADALQAAQQAMGTPNPRGPAFGLDRMEAVRRWLVRNLTDNRVDLAELQKEAQRQLGRPLTWDEMVLEQSRANPSGAAKVAIDETIRPAVQDVGPDRQNLSTLMRLLNNSDVAAATGNPARQFSGGLTGADSQAAAQHLWSALSPEQQRVLDTSSDALYRMVDHYRDEMVRAGVWTPQLAADLKQQYPHWVPTKILDYMNDPAAMTTGTKGISLRDRGLRRYTIEGTARAAEDPIASLVRYVQDAESIIQKNETFNAFVNLRDRVPGWDQMIREVSSSTPAATGRGEKTVTGFVNGERKTYIVPAPMAAAIQMEQGQQVPVLRQMTQLFKEFITRTPMFVAGQIPLDAFSYGVRETSREGGILAAPKVAAELARGYAEAFRGLLDGTYKGDAARYLKEGGGMAGFYERAADAAGKTVDDLTRRNMFEVRNAADAQKLAGWILTGGWVQAAGARVEMAPRIASFRLGEQRAARAGASREAAALQGMVGARDVTLDFQRGGTAAKVINQIVPFFNVGLQSAVTLPRMLRENPVGTATTLLGLVAAPTVAAEAWNRADPQRSADYDDVPGYVKDRGIVVMLPGGEGTDERGERRPNYALIPLRELAPVVILARDLAQRAIGKDGRTAVEGAQAMLGAASPVQASNAADLFSSFNPSGLNTGTQLAADRDFFRGGPIATDRRDEQASSLAKGIAGATGYRPSQTDFAVRDLFGGTGAMASAASDLATGKAKDEQRIQNTPLAGGLISRFVGDAVGGNLTRAQDAHLPAALTPVLREAGMRDDQVTPVGSRYRDAQLTRAEQERWQSATNSLIVREVMAARRSSEWRERGADKQQIISDAVSGAKQQAAERVLNRLTDQEIEHRKQREERRRAS